ncbi:MAG: glycosyltransferase family 4 protein [Bacteroidota bacterium]|nr:glycosyltransferase family 4 protein [Bacteroidota bacterium]
MRFKGSPRNILITSANFPTGSAAANYLNLFCKGLVHHGQAVEVFLLKGYFLAGRKTSDAKKNFTDYGTPYTYLGFINRSSNKLVKVVGDLYGMAALLVLLFSFLGRRKITTVFAYNNEIHHSIILNCFCRLSGIKLVTFVPEYYDISEFSGNFFHRLRWYSFLLNFHYLNRLSDKLIVFSRYIRDKYLEKKYPEKDILVQPNLTDFDFWYQGENEEKFTIGYSGTPYKKDGIEDLLSAISILKKRNIEVDAVIIGDVVNERSIIPSLKDFCEINGINGSVTFTGLVSLEEVREWLNKSVILAITRPNIVQTVAGFPTKLGEYFACRKIVLSTRVGDAGTYFRDRDEIVFAEAGNTDSIAENIEWILKNREEGKKIALNGFHKASKLLEYKSRVSAIMKFVNGIEDSNSET